MSVENEKNQALGTFVVEVTPSEIDAGADMKLVGMLSCKPEEDLRGQALLIKDQTGALVASAEFTEFEDGINRTGEFLVKAPPETGDFTWSAVLPALVPGRFPQEEISSSFSFSVKPHDTRVLVWDIPSAITRGETFTIKAGVKCSSECPTAGWALDVYDHNGVRVASSTIGNEVWPRTASLHFTQVELTPPDIGSYEWKVAVARTGTGLPHGEGTAAFRVKVVPPPECLIKVEAIDRKSQSPIKGAKVVVHPFKVFTDEQGQAELRVPKGQYRIYVSGSRHIPFRMESEVSGDMAIRAELDLDLGLSDADVWS